MRSLARNALSLILIVGTGRVWAGPVEFGLAELNRVAAERGLAPMSIKTAVRSGAPESYSVTPEKITGGDERGLMYGLLEAAEQIHRTGRITSAQGRPVTPMRGIRYFIQNEAMEKEWYYSKEYWEEYFTMLAKDRLNRFNLVFAHEMNYLAPPYPFWVELPDFPEIQVPGLSSEQRGKNLDMLCYIAQSAADHGIDFTLGIWEHNALERGTFGAPSVEGITDKNIGPYSYQALKKVLQTCQGIRSVQMRTNGESGISDAQQAGFFGDWVFRAIREAGRPVILDLRAHQAKPELLSVAVNSGLPLRISAKYWGEYMGRPYQPVETSEAFPVYSYMDALKKPRAHDFYWEIWSLGSHRLLLWGDPEYVRRATPTFSLSDSIGFEVDAPLAQKGFGNWPEPFGIFAKDDRKFWKWEFERYWMFYRLWGRLSYDPATAEDAWLGELSERFGRAAPEVMVAYQSAGRVISEIIDTHTIEPVQFIWPEINPGGLIGAYKDDVPYDASFNASPAEAARNVLHQIPSAKQGPHETAQILDGIATQIEEAVARVSSKLGDQHKEWRGMEPDFKVLAHLARYHARKQEAAYSLSWFFETGDLRALDRAEHDLVQALHIWQDLVKLTEGLYPDPMVYGPMEYGHWKDKLVYAHQDLAWIRELKSIQKKYGSYDFRYQFGPHLPLPTLGAGLLSEIPFASRSTLEPRFTLVDPGTMYSEESGYGWYGPLVGAIVARERPQASFAEVATIRARPERMPGQLPDNLLFGGSVLVPEGLSFRVRAGPGTFEAVTLYADGSEGRHTIAAPDGMVDVTFPNDGPRDISGLLLRNLASKPKPQPEEHYLKLLRRPIISHSPPRSALSGQALQLSVKVTPAGNVTAVRLHYRSLDALEKVRTLEASGANASFTIPAEDVRSDFDLLYYFEILNTEKGGWFQPDPAATTPYYVVSVKK